MRYLLILLIFLNGCAFSGFKEDGTAYFWGWGEHSDGDRKITSDSPIQLPKIEID